MLVITGTPGTGKTSVARLVSKKLDLPLIDSTRLIKKKKLFTGQESGCLIVDLKKLKKELTGFNGVVEGHILCEIKLPAKVVVLRASPRSIEKRLVPREYSKQKMKDNIEAEALDYCLIKSKSNYTDVIQIDTTGLCANKSAAKVVRYLRENQSDFIDWSEYFLR